MVLWSDASGAFFQRLDAHGGPTGARTRLGAPCPGGIAAVASDEGIFVACLRPGDRDRDREGSLVLYEIGDGDGVVAGRTGMVGDESRGVDVAAHGSRVVVGWRDADVFVARARLAEREGDGLSEPRALSSEGTLSSAPSLLFVGEQMHVAWTESWFDRGRAAGHLLALREGDPPRPSLGVFDIDVRTHLTADARGPMVTLRDSRPRGARHRAFIGRLDQELRLTREALESPGRADAVLGRPMLVPCDGHVFMVATRRSSREVTMVTLRRLSESLEPLEDEQQIYEYHARFPHAVATCVEGRLLVAVGEQASQGRPTPELHTYELVCEPGLAHARTPEEE